MFSTGGATRTGRTRLTVRMQFGTLISRCEAMKRSRTGDRQRRGVARELIGCPRRRARGVREIAEVGRITAAQGAAARGLAWPGTGLYDWPAWTGPLRSVRPRR